MKAQQKNNRRYRDKKTTNSDGPHDAEDDKSKKTGGRPKGNIMKNNTFDQIINSDLASIDPGFGQSALAKASADLMKKVLNK